MSIDIAIPLGKIYPDMVKTDQLGEVFQTNVISHFIYSRPLIDLFNDIIGLAFIFAGSALLLKRSKKFITTLLLAPVASVLYAIIPQLPYHFQAKELYLMVAGFSFMVTFFVIYIEYMLMYGIIKMTSCIQNKWNSNEMQIGWLIVMVNKGLLVLIKFFYGQNFLYIAYSIVMFAGTVWFVNRMLKTLEIDPEINVLDNNVQSQAE